MFTRVVTSTSGKDHILPGYHEPRITAESDPLLAFLLSDERVKAVHWVHGDFDVLAIIKTQTVVAACDFLERIRGFPSVLNTSTTLCTGQCQSAGMI